MKNKIIGFVALMLISFNALGFDTVTKAKIRFIDEYDIGFTQIELDPTTLTSCGGARIWISRNMTDYNLYLARALTALATGKYIRLAERSPAYCSGTLLYNPRIGIE